MPSLPPSDYRVPGSPTRTRSDWEAHADELLAAAWRHSSPLHARVFFPSDVNQNAVDGLEGFARTFLLGALRLAGSAGQKSDIAEWYADALDAGTAPDSPERWPDLVDHGQPTVEATAIVLALQWSRPWIWDRLPQRVQDNLAQWLSGAHGRFGADNNHVMFGAAVQAFLASAGYPHDPFEIEAALARIEDWYAGDGWYSDGPGRRFDHYNAWTFQLYPFFILNMLGEAASERRELYRRRLGYFVEGYQHLFGADGSPLLQGRSLIYRWGVVAPFWMAQLEGVSTVSPGRTRRLANSVLNHFLERGAVKEGIIGLGWHGNHPSILQSYNAPGSPHWASKGFLGLLLPAGHPAWSGPEEPMPVELSDTSVLLAGPRWHVGGTRSTGVIRVLNFGTDGHPQSDDALYRRLAFSTATVPLDATEGGLPLRDNDIYIDLGGGRVSRHRGLSGGTARYDGGSSRFQLDAAGRGITVDYAATVLEGVEVRVGRVTGLIGMPLTVSGYAVSSDDPVVAAAAGNYAQVAGRGRSGRDAGAAELVSKIALHTCDAAVASVGRCALGDSTALGTHSAVPLLEFEPIPVNVVRIAWLVGLGEPSDTLEDTAAGLKLEWVDDGAQLEFRGTSRVLPWQREDPWRADQANQGVFRWAPRLPSSRAQE